MSVPSEAKLNRRKRLGRIWATIWRGVVKYNETDGEQRAAAFAYYALFSLLPLLVLLISVGTRFLGNREQATNEVFRLIAPYTQDIGSNENVRQVVLAFMNSRLGTGVISAVIILWCALRFFQSLVHGVNKAWGTKEYTWWRLPLKNLLMILILTSALLIGVVVPAILNAVERFYKAHEALGEMGWLFGLARDLLPPLLLFYALILFYKFAPRRPTTLREVWIEALWVTLLLGGLQKLFAFYVSTSVQFNVYGAFGGVVALLMWIYFTGAVIILGGCFCAARGEIRRGLTDQSEREQAAWDSSDEPSPPKF